MQLTDRKDTRLFSWTLCPFWIGICSAAHGRSSNASYDEATLLYVLGLGSPTHPLPAESYTAWTSTCEWKTIYGRELLYGGPLFIHQYSHIWLDVRGIQDKFARDEGFDYCENSRRATYVQREYAIRNPQSAGLCRLRRKLLGTDRQRWAGLDDASPPGCRALVL